jgi:hypothetical protein
MLLGDVINGIVQTRVALGRITEFLNVVRTTTVRPFAPSFRS